MNKCSKINMSIIAVLATGLTVFSAAVIAHDDNEPGTSLVAYRTHSKICK
jgi:hypothetical protein